MRPPASPPTATSLEMTSCDDRGRCPWRSVRVTFAELTAHGATLGYDEAVSLARAELDRVIANDEG